MMRTLLLILAIIGYSNLTLAQYPDLSTDIPWSGSFTDIDAVEVIYNDARVQENGQLTTSLPPIDFPTQVVWDALSDSKKALWIANIERLDRGLVQFEGIDTRIINVAQPYAQYLADNNTSGHNADGLGFQARLESDPDIAACWQDAYEGIGYLVSSSAPPAYSVAKIMYLFIYDDSGSSWGHRQHVLLDDYTDDSGVIGEEGLIGVGIVQTTNYQGFFSQTYNYASIGVFNAIDPCSSWVFESIGLDENVLSSSQKKVVKVVDLLGRECQPTPNTLLIYIYSDGTKKKVCHIE